MKAVLSTECGHLSPLYSISLPSELTDGHYINIRWVTPESGKNTSFNIGEGPDFDSTVLFHYNPRFGADVVVRNTKDSTWGTEEVDGGMPFSPETAHVLKIVVRSGFYECFVDGVKHIEYNHRLAIDTAKFLFIGGEGEIHKVCFGNEDDECEEVLTIPYNKSTNIFIGSEIYVSGTPTSDTEKFYTEFNVGEDLAFRFAVRMDESVVIMNNRVDDVWQTEERPEEFPFQKDTFFNIHIKVLMDKFKVCVNDMDFAEFTHRILPVSSITGVSVDGGVDLRHIEVW